MMERWTFHNYIQSLEESFLSQKQGAFSKLIAWLMFRLLFRKNSSWSKALKRVQELELTLAAARLGMHAERVTAQEIEATRAAGGNRLNGIHRHIERTALFLILKKCFRSIQQFVTEDETMPLAREEDPDTIEFINVGPEELNKNLHLKPRGADYIADEEFELKQRIDFINTAAQVQPMAEQLNWSEIAKDLARRFLRDDWEKYINPQQPQQGAAQQLTGNEAQQPPEGAQQPQQQPEEPQSEVDAIRQAARSFAGPPGEQALEATMRSGQGQETLEQLGNAMKSDRENK